MDRRSRFRFVSGGCQELKSQPKILVWRLATSSFANGFVRQ